MKKHTFAAALCGLLTLTSTHLSAQEVDDKYVENDVVSLAGKKGFSFSTKAGDFLFKPYALVQASACLNRYDDLGLETPYADNIANTGFAIPNAILGFTGKAFGKVTFNLSINAAKSGGALLQQAWFDIAMKESLRIRVGKFKTPFMHTSAHWAKPCSRYFLPPVRQQSFFPTIFPMSTPILPQVSIWVYSYMG